MTAENFANFFAGTLFGAFLALGFFIIFLLSIAIYAYTAFAWMTIAKKQKYKHPWLAWIPFANVAMILQLAGFHWAWVFLFLLPIFGWIALFILVIISTWKIFEKLKHSGWFSLSVIIPYVGGILYLIAIGIVAWSKPQQKNN